jgi:hypothetical protein
MALQSQVHSAFNRIAASVDPFFFDPDRPDLSIVLACTYSQDTAFYEELREAIDHLQTANSKLSDQIQRHIPREAPPIPQFQAVFEPQDQRKLSRLKEAVDAQMSENEALRQRIACLDRRIDLMRRKKSYVSDLGLIRMKRPLVEHDV